MCESRERSAASHVSLCGCRVIGAFHLSSRQRSVQTKTERSAATGAGVQTPLQLSGKPRTRMNHATGVRDPPHGARRGRCAVTKSKNEIRETRRFSFHSRFTITGSRSPRSLTYGALRVASGFSLFTLKPYVIVPHAHRTTDLLIETREREQGQGAQGGACDMEINDHMPPPPPHALRHR